MMAHVVETDRVGASFFFVRGARWIRTIDLILIRASGPDSLTGSFAYEREVLVYRELAPFVGVIRQVE
jgi:hypothetical protein